MEHIAKVTLRTSLMPGPNNELFLATLVQEGLEMRLADLLNASSSIEVVSAQIADEPAAAGEVKTLEETLEEEYIPLQGTQMVRAEKILHLATSSFTLEVKQLSICPQTGAVVGWIRTKEGQAPQLFSHVVSQNSVRFILG